MTFLICNFILVMQLLWRVSEQIMGKGIGISVYLEFFYYASAQLLPTTLPLAILLASLMTFGNFGERLELLAMKAAGAAHEGIPCMIFDEIDTGISGRAAQKTGFKLAEISKKRQVICVTHLAQIAALSDNHLLIEKKTDDSRTYTTVHNLSEDEKISEIARIISGDNNDSASLINARELINKKNLITAEDLQ